MPWVRIDEEFYLHPKVVAAGPLAMAMQVAGLCYCNRYLTDGFLPKAVSRTLLDFAGIAMNCWKGEMIGGGEDATAELVIDRLLDAGMWVEEQGGYRIHDFHIYQPRKVDVEEDRRQKREAGRLGGLRSGQARRNARPADASQNEAVAQAVAESLAQAHA